MGVSGLETPIISSREGGLPATPYCAHARPGKATAGRITPCRTSGNSTIIQRLHRAKRQTARGMDETETSSLFRLCHRSCELVGEAGVVSGSVTLYLRSQRKRGLEIALHCLS